MFSNWMNSNQRNKDWLNDVEDEREKMHYSRVIQDAPAVIVLERFDRLSQQNILLPPQEVRIEMTRIEPDREVGPAARQANFNVVITGLSTLDIENGDQFEYSGKIFEVLVVYINTPGGTQAWAKAQE